MRKIISVILVLLLSIVGVTPVFATMSTPKVVFYPDTLMLEISGNVEGANKDYVSVYITKLALGEITTQAINDGEVLFISRRTDKTGEYLFSYNLADTTPGGQYNVYVICNGERASGGFLLFNEKLANKAVDLINKASDTTIAGVIKDNLSAFGLDIGEYNTYNSYIGKIVYNCKPAGGYDIDGFIAMYKTAVAVGSIKEGKSTLRSAIEDNSSYVAVTVDEYDAFDDELMKETEHLFKTVEYTAESFRNAFENNVLLAKIRLSADAEALGNVVLNNNSVIKLDLDEYNNINNEYYQANVFVNIYNQSKSVTSFEELKVLFDNEVSVQAAEYEKYKNKAPSSGGGGGGGGGASIPKDTVSVFVPEIEEVVQPEETITFADTENHWAKDEISRFVKTEIINGYPDGTFKPDNNITRAEFSVLIYKMLSLSPVFEKQFGDVTENDWHYKYINAVVNAGIVKGYDGIFAPDTPISRQDMAVMVYRMLGITDGAENDYEFKDHNSISAYAEDAVYALQKMNVINGSEGNFNPKNNATRAEAVKILSNALGYIE